MEFGGHAPGFRKARDHIESVRVIDMLQALPICSARIVGVRVEIDGEVTDIGFHDVDCKTDPECHTQPNSVFVRLLWIFLRIDKDSSGHCCSKDHDGVFAEWEPTDHWCAVNPRIGHKRNATDRPDNEDCPVPPPVDLSNKHLSDEYR